MSATDVVQALTALTNYLKNVSGSQKSSYITPILAAYPNPDDAKSFALRLVIHYVGDIHQPLHTTSEVNDQFPVGDRGGNSHKIPNVSGASNLHAVWDSVLYEYTAYPNLPLSSSDYSWYTSTAATQYKNYPISSSKIHSSNFNYWAQEGLQISQDYVYAGFVEGQVPSATYQNKGEQKLFSQMNYGARRLASLVEDLYAAQ